MFNHIITLIAIGAIILFYCMALIDYLAPATFGSSYADSFDLLLFANRIALIVLLINGTLIDSPKFKFIKLALGVIFAGAIMKILHLPVAHELISLAIVGIAITYTFHFYSKRERGTLGILKFLVVILIAFPLELIADYQLPTIYIRGASELLCAITFLYFLYAERDSYMRNPNT